MNFPNVATTGINQRNRYLVGVSGGRDSVALLHWLKDEIKCKDLIVCHLNHALRGRESGADVSFVRRMARSYGLKFELERVDVRKISNDRKLSIEVAAREARLEFFARASKKWRCRRVILAHHADDHVETVLINLFRGSGRLTGMRKVSEICVNGKRIELLRPLLGVWRDDVNSYVKKHGIRFREDSSNLNKEFLRNRIRHELVPLLNKTFQRDVTKAVSRAAEVSMRESDMMNELLADSEYSWLQAQKLSVPKLRQLDYALQCRGILQWLRLEKVPGVGFAEVELVLSLLSEKSPAKINLPGGKHVRRRKKVLFIE